MGIPARVGLARSSTVQSSVQSASTRRADVRTPSREGDSLRREVGMSTVQSSVQSASTRRADVRTPSREGDSLRREVGMIAYGRD